MDYEKSLHKRFWHCRVKDKGYGNEWFYDLQGVISNFIRLDKIEREYQNELREKELLSSMSNVS
jgi:hypothetical protein